MSQTAFVLLGFPVEIKGADGGKGGEGGVDDAEINVMTEVDPDGHEDGEVRDGDGGLDVM